MAIHLGLCVKIPPFFIPVLALAAATAASAADFRLLARYPIGGIGGYDYLRVDPDTRRLYVAHGNRVDVLDADTGASIGQVAPTRGVHGIALDRALNRGFITDGADRAVTVFDLRTLKTIAVIHGLGVKPDAIEFDPDTGRVYVANGASGGITVIEPATAAIAAVIPVEGKLEGMAFDGRGRLFVNTENRSAIQVVDLRAGRVVALWPVAPVEGGTGLAIDRSTHRLFCAGGNGMLAVVNSDTGAVVATPPIGEDPDGDAFNPATGLIFTSNVGGTLSILHEDAADTYRTVQTVATAYGARTIALDRRTGRVFLPTGRFGPAPAPTADRPNPRPRLLPGTFEVLVVGQ